MDRGDAYFSGMAAEKLRGKGPFHAEGDLGNVVDGFGYFLSIN
jgi:hypothetical protein